MKALLVTACILGAMMVTSVGLLVAYDYHQARKADGWHRGARP